jgi:subtilase family serine protease
MHTNFLIYVPASRPEGRIGFTKEEFPDGAYQPVTGDIAETPASIACLYKQATVTSAACDPATVTTVSTGGSNAIAIVDAYDYPNAVSDLTYFSNKFGLAPINPAHKTANFTVVFQGTTNPGPDPACAGGNGTNCWGSEEALDIEMAHAMAPKALLYLVEANSEDNGDMYAAVTKAVKLVQAAGGGEVSMSWGGPEYATELKDDKTFAGSGVVFFASTGDAPGIQYPSTSPNIVAVGGTTISRNASTFAFQRELTWDSAGGGFSVYEPRPSFQKESLVGDWRGVPDVAAVGNPYTGVWIYDTFETDGTPWIEIGGTSVSAPVWAGIVNRSGHFKTSSLAELTMLYANEADSSDIRDLNDGACGPTFNLLAVTGWDPCTGVGSPIGTAGK